MKRRFIICATALCLTGFAQGVKACPCYTGKPCAYSTCWAFGGSVCGNAGGLQDCGPPKIAIGWEPDSTEFAIRCGEKFKYTIPWICMTPTIFRCGGYQALLCPD